MKLNRIDLYVILAVLAVLVLTYAFSHRYYIDGGFVLDTFTGEVHRSISGGK